MSIFPILPLAEIVYDNGCDRKAEVVVVITLYNYAEEVLEATQSVVEQDIGSLAIIVIDDCSDDGGGAAAANFLRKHGSRFAAARVIRHKRNQGVAMARNSGIAWTSEPFIFMLDADNRIRPPALSRLRAALQYSGASFAYSQLARFGAEVGVGPAAPADIWEPSRLREGNYIDAMALIRRDALGRAGGYRVSAVEEGWEDYDLWCRFAEMGLEGVFIPELLCEYRVHDSSMLRTRTNPNGKELMAEMALRHPALFLAEDEDIPVSW